MCLANRVPVNIERTKAFKIFGVSSSNKLISAFFGAYSPNLYYVPEQLTEVDIPDRTFFAFASKDGPECIWQNSTFWNVTTPNLVVLPVTLVNIVYIGKFVSEPLDELMDAYESRKIIVHDSVENRREHYKKVTTYDSLQTPISPYLMDCANRFLKENPA